MLSNRLNNITPSYTIGISTKVSELKEQGIDVIDFSIGEPDFFTPNEVKKEGIYSIENNYTKYNKVSGYIELRKSIKEKLLKENNSNYDIDEIVVSNGAKHAITNTLLSILDKNDEVLIPKPYWVSYPEMVKLIGAAPIFIDTKLDNDFKVTPEDIQKYSTPKTKLLFLTNPSNPSGIVYSKEELESIVKTCIKNNIYILADEIYERICYDTKFTSIASLSEAAKNITITINGFSKSASMTGWRLGYSASNKEIAKAISMVQGHLVSHPCTISQRAGIAALTKCKDEIDIMVDTYKKRRDLVLDYLNKINNITYIYPQGAFYVFIDISDLKEKIKYTKSYSVAFCDKLLEEYNLAVVPGISFGMDDYIRISYACDTESLKKGLKRLKEFIDYIS